MPDKTLYVYRPLLNAQEVVNWAKDQGFETTLPPEDMHVTVARSKQPLDWAQFEPDTGEITVVGGGREVKKLGEATVLRFESVVLNDRWQAFIDGGASWDFEGYLPHVSVSWKGPDNLSGMVPYMGDLVFGAEQFEEINDNWAASVVEKGKAIVELIKAKFNRPAVVPGKILKSSEEQRIVYGWASVATVKGALVTDTHGHVITPNEMEAMANDFMLSVRTAKAMHQGNPIGEVVHSLPLTADIAKAFGITVDREGWIIAMKIHDNATWDRVKSGELGSFSIGGRGFETEEIK